MDRPTLQNYRTSGTSSPTSENILDGEIAVGMNVDSPRLWAKLTDGTFAEYVPKSYIDDKLDNTNTYKLSIDDEGSLYCTKNNTGEGFSLDTDGSLSLA